MPEGPANQESAILQPVAMHDRYGPFLRSFFARYFNPIRFPEEAIDKIKQLKNQGNIVYLARSANTLHFLYLNHLCIRNGLPLARFVNGIDPILMQPIGLLLDRMRTLGSDSDEDLDEEGEHLPNRQLASVLAAGQASLLFLDKPATITNPESPQHDGLLETLISSQQSQDKPIFLIPHLIVWDIHPETESKALTDAVFGLPESPGFLRTLYLLLRYRRKAFVKVAEPINLLDFINSQPDQNQADLAGSLQELVENKISLEVFDVTGPRIRRDTEFKQAILKDSKITELIESECDNDETKNEALKKKAYDILDEIAAEPRIRWPIYLDKALNFF